jgi:AraC-like DNA-binding protein
VIKSPDSANGMPAALRFDSADYPGDAAFQAYAALYSNGSDVTRAPGPFAAKVWGGRLDGVIVFERNLSGVRHARQARVETDGFDHFVFTAVSAGQVTGSPESGFASAGPGEMFVTDMTRRSSVVYDDASVLTASITRDMVRSAMGAAGDLHGRVLAGPAVQLLAALLRTAARVAADLPLAAQGALSRAIVELLGATNPVSPARGESARRDYLKRELIERYIASNLGQRGLSAEMIGEATGLSRSALYRLYEERGGVARLVQRRRVEALRLALDSRDASSWADLAQRYGFSDARKMNAAFLSVVGLSPSAYRKVVATTAPYDLSDNFRRWQSWMCELD